MLPRTWRRFFGLMRDSWPAPQWWRAAYCAWGALGERERERERERLIPKFIGNRKRDCAWGCAGVKKLKKINCWAQIIKTHICFAWWWFVLNNWFFFNFLTPAHPHAQSPFLFPIVFGINLIEFFDVSWRWPLREGRDGRWEGGNDKCELLARESTNLSPILARQWWRHFCLTTSISLLPSLSLYLSLSLSPIVPHAQ